MKALLIFFLAEVFLGASAMAVTIGGCGPGNGGVPLVDVSNHISANEKILKTDGGVKEFVLWERSGKVVYRNADDKIATFNLASGMNEILGNGGVPLAHLLDPDNRFVMGAGIPWIFDTAAGGWYQFASNAAQLKPEFWFQGMLVTARIVVAGSYQRIEVYGYTPSMGSPQPICRPFTFSKTSGPLQLADGSRFPNIYFYTQAVNQNGNNLGLGRIDLMSCELAEMNQYPYIFYGPIESVHVFDRLHSFSVKVNHPSYNLLWHSGYGSCSYYNIDNLEPFVLSESLPRVATFAPGGGLRIVDMNAQTEATVLKNLPIADISDNDLWMTQDGKTLYAAPRLVNQSSRLLMQLKLKMTQR